MPATARLWFGVLVGLFIVLAAVQAHDAYVWATVPWFGASVLDQGRLEARNPSDIAPPLRGLMAEHALRLVAVAIEGKWLAITADGDWERTGIGPSPRAAWKRLVAASGGVAPGDRMGLRLIDAAGRQSEVEVEVRRMPGSIVLERILPYSGMGLLIGLFGLGVLAARPGSGEALAFAAFSGAFGLQLLTTQVYGGFPTRFFGLSLAGCYATPAAAAWLGFASLPGKRRVPPWIVSLPWIVALGGALAACFEDLVLNDLNIYIRTLRPLGYLVYGGAVVWARFQAPTRQQARRYEFYLAGLAVGLLLPTIYYSLPTDPHKPVPPYIMLSLLAIPIVLGYGILKHRLFDIEVMLRRGLGYSLIAAVAVPVYALAVAGAGTLFGDAVRSPLFTFAFVGLGLAVGGGLRPRLQALVDRGVNPTRARYLEAMRAEAEELGELASTQAVADGLVRIATGTAGLTAAAVYIRHGAGYSLAARGGQVREPSGTLLEADEPLVQLAALVRGEIHRDDFASNPRLASLAAACLGRMDALGVDLLMPLRCGRARVVGLLALGVREDGRPLNSEDLALLTSLANQAALGIARAEIETASAPVPTRAVTPGPGVSVGHYRIEGLLGEGGMGTVYRAVDTRLDRVVALKFLRPHHGGSQEMLQRLRREARLMASFNHPSLMQIHALEEVDGQTFLAVEYIAGQTLMAELEDRGRLPPAEVVAVAAAVVRGLRYAYERGIIHRDLKLQNLMRTTTGELKITDFGLAKPLTDEASLTDAGRVVGTMSYLAPELRSGGRASFKSDMYAVGVCLQRLLLGPDSVPRHGLTGLVDPAPLREAGAPDALVWAISRLLEPDPERRYDGYEELADDLERAREGGRADAVDRVSPRP